MTSDYSRRQPSTAEEKANSISHGLGLVASLAAAPLLVWPALKNGGGLAVIGPGVFAASMVCLYLASTLYHSLSEARGKNFFRILDHAAIFILIAGSYTPFTLGVLHGPWGWTLLGVVWSLAIIGLIMKAVPSTRYSRASIVLYVAMGWLAIIATRPILSKVAAPGVGLIVAGGLAYTFGLIFFRMQRLRFHHFIWHLFVLTGTICHFFAVLWYSDRMQ